MIIAGETYDVYFCHVLECMRALYRDPGFTPILVFSPEHHYTNADKTDWLFHDMHKEVGLKMSLVRLHQEVFEEGQLDPIDTQVGIDDVPVSSKYQACLLICMPDPATEHQIPKQSFCK